MAQRKSTSGALTDETGKELTALISDYLGNQLDPGLRRKLERNLHNCSDCLNFLKSYEKTVATTGALDPIMMPARVRDNLLAFLCKKIQKVAAFSIYVASQFFAQLRPLPAS